MICGEYLKRTIASACLVSSSKVVGVIWNVNEERVSYLSFLFVSRPSCSERPPRKPDLRWIKSADAKNGRMQCKPFFFYIRVYVNHICIKWVYVCQSTAVKAWPASLLTIFQVKSKLRSRMLTWALLMLWCWIWHGMKKCTIYIYIYIY